MIPGSMIVLAGSFIILLVVKQMHTKFYLVDRHQSILISTTLIAYNLTVSRIWNGVGFPMPTCIIGVVNSLSKIVNKETENCHPIRDVKGAEEATNKYSSHYKEDNMDD